MAELCILMSSYWSPTGNYYTITFMFLFQWFICIHLCLNISSHQWKMFESLLKFPVFDLKHLSVKGWLYFPFLGFQGFDFRYIRFEFGHIWLYITKIYFLTLLIARLMGLNLFIIVKFGRILGSNPSARPWILWVDKIIIANYLVT